MTHADDLRRAASALDGGDFDDQIAARRLSGAVAWWLCDLACSSGWLLNTENPVTIGPGSELFHAFNVADAILRDTSEAGQ